MVGQPASTINPWRFVAEGKIVLFHTGRTVVGDEFASFMGSVILNYVRRAILAQGASPAAERVPATVIIDESQTMAAVDYASIMAEAQKFGGSILISTQGLSLLEPTMQRENAARVALDRQLLANTDTLVVFRVQGDDAWRISTREFGEEVPATTLLNLPQYTAYVRTVVGRDVVPPFAVQTKLLPEEDSAVRSKVLAMRSEYSLPFEEAKAASHRAMNVILDYFGTEVAAATAIHDGAFGDLLGVHPVFPAATETEVVGRREEAGQDEAATNETPQQRQLDFPEGKNEKPAGKTRPPRQGSGEGSAPRDRMLDLLDRVEGWIDGTGEDRGPEVKGTDPKSE
jgi:hypothetical protein